MCLILGYRILSASKRTGSTFRDTEHCSVTRMVARDKNLLPLRAAPSERMRPVDVPPALREGREETTAGTINENSILKGFTLTPAPCRGGGRGSTAVSPMEGGP